MAGAAELDVRALAAKPGFRRAVFLLLLVLVNLPVYGPALNRFFSGDQLYYFAERNNDRSLSAGLAAWDYNATRRMAKGDEALFRPILNCLLAVENTLYGYDYRAWNITNLVLHLGVSFVLFELLCCLQASIFAPAFALVFSVLTADLELVVWNHLGGYLLGYGLLLLSILALRRLTEGAGESERRWLVVYGLAIGAAMLCCELPVVAALLMVGYVELRRRRSTPASPRSAPRMAALMLPLGLYVLLYGFHIARCERWFWMAAGTPASGNESYVLRVAKSLGFWALKALDPWYAAISTRNFARFNWAGDATVLASHAIAVAGLLLGLILCFRRGVTRAHLASNGLFAALPALLLLAYSAINNLGRIQSREFTYYLYFFSLMSAVGVYALIDFSRLGRVGRPVALGLLCVLGVLNAQRTWTATRDLAAQNARVIDYFDKIEEFVNLHRSEEGFAFAVRGEGRPDPFYEVWMGYPDLSPGGKPSGYAAVSTLLYPRYVDPRILKTGPDLFRHKYLVEWNSGAPK